MEPSSMPLSSSDELTGLFLGAVASPQSRPPLHPVHSNYNGPIQQRSVPESDTTFLLLPIRQAKAALEAETRAELERGPDPNKTGHKPKSTGTPGDKVQRNFTDPESRIMKDSHGFIQAYNAQAAVDGASQVIVGQLLTNTSSDAHQMIPMLQQIRTNLRQQV